MYVVFFLHGKKKRTLNTELERHMNQWRSHARGLMRDEVKGDDLLAETLLKIMENQQSKAEQIASEGNLYAYVNRAMYLMACDYSSRYHVKYRKFELIWNDQSMEHIEEPETTWIGSRLDNEYLDAYIALMPEMEAIMLRLYMMDDFSYKELSKKTKIPVKDLYKIVEMAINKLRRNVSTSSSSSN